jgi:hypothetical protein
MTDPNGIESPIINLLKVLDTYERNHVTRYDSAIANDYALGAAWLEIAKSARTLLNGELGRLDAGTLDGILLDMIVTAGFSESDLQ